MKKLFLFIIPIFLFSCNLGNKNITVIKEKDIIFDVGYCCRYSEIGTCNNNDNKTNYIYFAEPFTEKKLKYLTKILI
jgi:hypothetical protein